MFFAVLVGAFALGQAANNVESLVTAQGSAGAVYSIIDRVSDKLASREERRMYIREREEINSYV